MYPESVSHFEIVKKLGEGGMGVVYQARDTDLGRMVALKFLPAEIASSPEKIVRFRQEARAISTLNHPHIATIYGMEDTDDSSFLILEYLPGGNLKQKLTEMKERGEQPSLRQVIDWMIQISEGLAHAHRNGIVHRDMKASNLLFTGEEQIKIADFGLAKISLDTAGDAADLSLTQPGLAVGTPPSMSPEQAMGHEVDRRSDLFSLGILFFELIAGRPPFRSNDSVALLHKIVYSSAPPLSQFRLGLPAGLQPIVSRLLEKQPESRYQTADELIADLESLRAELDSGDSQKPAVLDTATMPGARPPRPSGARVPVMVIAAALSIAVCIPRAVNHGVWFQLRTIPSEKRIAVLLFRNEGGDPRNQALVDGLMEVVSNSLTGLEETHGALFVVPASDVRKEKIESAREAHRILGANLAVTGSVQRSGANIQVLINLVDAAAVVQLRSDRLRTNISDASLSESVVAKVAQMLDLALQEQDSKTLNAGSTKVAGASRYYLEGLGYLRHDDRPESLEKALKAFTQALVLDPKYVLAYTGAAQAYCRRYQAQKDLPSIDAALWNSQHALDLNDQLAPVHITMGMVRALQGQYEMAEKEFRQALKIDPHNADAYRELAATYEKLGRAGQAEDNFKEAIKERPGDWWGLKQLGVFYFHKGRLLEARHYFEELIKLTPGSAKAYSNLGAVYWNLHRNGEAAEQFRTSIAIEPNANGWANLGFVYYFSGQFDKSAEAYKAATDLDPGESDFWGDLADACRWAPGLESRAPGAYHQAIDKAGKDLAINQRQDPLRAKVASYWASLAAMEHSNSTAARRDRDRALSEIARALQQSGSDKSVQFRAALVYEQTNQRKRALQALKAALDGGFDRDMILKDPPLADLRKDPAFLHLLEPGKPGSGQTPPK